MTTYFPPMKIELALPLLSAPLMRSGMHCNLYYSVKCLAYFRDLRFVLVPTYLYKNINGFSSFFSGIFSMFVRFGSCGKRN
jgi:hypothetical protein